MPGTGQANTYARAATGQAAALEEIQMMRFADLSEQEILALAIALNARAISCLGKDIRRDG
jgi:hypothetical protein